MTIKLHRRQIVLASLIFALGAAVYLNWQFSPKYNELANESNTSSEVKYVDGPANYNDDNNEKQELNSIRVHNDDYFENAKKNREFAYKQSLETIKAALNDLNNIDDKTKLKLENQYSEMVKINQIQADIENLVIAKGYKKCVAIVQNGECHVIASLENFDRISENDSNKHVIRLKNIVQSCTGFGNDKIKVVTKT
ncbi:MAG: spoIIIAH-like protein [Candidatus Improbicoccus pseudotrichonymphae]|uniref:SpoIIIAH-like protein n=1 Tax=Candidatus Improbicoccus pseudotrichonymphae TaxID=3033792 RepID=A0AA48I1B6_9FIRM|nr:MAG: spoIIIAH-like protein [Candidatus Improbicoccus pseudotrichonymphae]